MKSNLYWAPPACEEETVRQDLRSRKKNCFRRHPEKEEGVGDGTWTDKQEQGSKTNRGKKKKSDVEAASQLS